MLKHPYRKNYKYRPLDFVITRKMNIIIYFYNNGNFFI